MANSYRLLVQAVLNDGTRTYTFTPAVITEVPTTAGEFGGRLLIGTSAEALSFGDIASPKRVHLENLHDTNTVDFGYNNAGTVGPFQLAPGDVNVVSVKSGDTIYFKASGASTPIRAWITSA